MYNIIRNFKVSSKGAYINFLFIENIKKEGAVDCYACKKLLTAELMLVRSL